MLPLVTMHDVTGLSECSLLKIVSIIYMCSMENWMEWLCLLAWNEWHALMLCYTCLDTIATIPSSYIYN